MAVVGGTKIGTYTSSRGWVGYVQCVARWCPPPIETQEIQGPEISKVCSWFIAEVWCLYEQGALRKKQIIDAAAGDTNRRRRSDAGLVNNHSPHSFRKRRSYAGSVNNRYPHSFRKRSHSGTVKNNSPH